jgi:hypothetical protein
VTDEASAETLRDGAAGRPSSPAASSGGLPVIDREHYDVDKEIARGGMGRIYTARDKRLGREVAVKEVLARDADLLARFDREVRLTARLQHPGIVSIYEAGKWTSGEPFFAMRLIAGRPLDQVVTAAKTLADRLALVPKLLAVAEAMAYAHGKRIIHRDLKPQNVLVGDFGETVVIDWGLAKDLDDLTAESLPGREAAGSESLTVFGSIMGTPSYMPIEQATGQPLDERADVYAIGAILYQALSGRPPYVGKTASRVLDALVAGPPPRLTSVDREVPHDLVAIVERAMARDAKDRYPSAKELAEDLRRYLTGQLVASHAYTTGELVRRWLKRHRGAVAVGSVAVLALVGVGIASYTKVVAERDRANGERDTAQRAEREAKRAQAELLVDRARAMIVAGTPARAAPVLVDALDRGASDPAVDLLAGEIAAALPAPVWTRPLRAPLAVADDGGFVARPPLADALKAAGAPADASAAQDPSGKLVAFVRKTELVLSDGKVRATTTGCGDEDQALDVTQVTATGTVVGVCRALDGATRAIAVWVPGGKLVLGDEVRADLTAAVASNDGAVTGALEPGGVARLMRGGARVSLGTLPAVTALAISADGELAATGTAQGLVQVWEVGSARELALVDTGEPVVALAFTPGLVVAAGKRGNARAWSTTGLLRALPIVDKQATGPRTVIALRGTDRGIAWATATPHDVVALDDKGARIGTLAAPDGAVFDLGATLGSTGLIAAIAHRGDVDKGGRATVVIPGAEIALADPRPLGATLSDDDHYVFAGGQIIRIADQRVWTQPLSPWQCQSTGGDRAVCLADASAALTGGEVALYHLPDGARIELAKVARGVPNPAITFVAAGGRVYVGGCTDALGVISVDGEVQAAIPLEQAACVQGLEVSETIGVAALATRRVVVFGLDGTRHGTIVLDGALESLALSAHGDYAALATSDGRIGIYALPARTLLAVVHVPADVPLALRLAFVDDHTLFATTSHRAWRIPWTQPADPGWRARSFVAADGTVAAPH